MITVNQLMQDRGDSSTYCISPQATVFDALKLMAEKNVGALMVCENGEILGIFTERDYARKIILVGKSSLHTPLSEIMTRHMVTIHPEQTLETCMALMTEHHIRHLPVTVDDKLVGMVSMRDVVQAIISRKDSTIENLENYIMGREYMK